MHVSYVGELMYMNFCIWAYECELMCMSLETRAQLLKPRLLGLQDQYTGRRFGKVSFVCFFLNFFNSLGIVDLFRNRRHVLVVPGHIYSLQTELPGGAWSDIPIFRLNYLFRFLWAHKVICHWLSKMGPTIGGLPFAPGKASYWTIMMLALYKYDDVSTLGVLWSQLSMSIMMSTL